MQDFIASILAALKVDDGRESRRGSRAVGSGINGTATGTSTQSLGGVADGGTDGGQACGGGRYGSGGGGAGRNGNGRGAKGNSNRPSHLLKRNQPVHPLHSTTSIRNSSQTPCASQPQLLMTAPPVLEPCLIPDPQLAVAFIEKDR